MDVGVSVLVRVAVAVGVQVVAGVHVAINVGVSVGTDVGVNVLVGASVAVLVGVSVNVGVTVVVIVGVGVPAIRVYCTVVALPWSQLIDASFAAVRPPQMLYVFREKSTHSRSPGSTVPTSQRSSGGLPGR